MDEHQIREYLWQYHGHALWALKRKGDSLLCDGCMWDFSKVPVKELMEHSLRIAREKGYDEGYERRGKDDYLAKTGTR